MAKRLGIPSGPGGVYDLSYELVWCPKYRRPSLTGDVALRCEELLREKAVENSWEILHLGIHPDLVHIQLRAEPADSPAFLASQLKGYTSRMLRSEFPELRSKLGTLWSRSFYVASLGETSEEAIAAYLDSLPTKKAASPVE